MPSPLLRLILPLVLITGGLRAQESEAPPPLTEREKAHHLLSRLTFGPRPGDVTLVLREGISAWMERQLEPRAIPDEDLDRRLAPLKTLGLSPKELNELYRAMQEEGGEQMSMMRIRNRGAFNRHVRDELRSAVILRGLYGERQLEEVLLDFWRNHFNVDVNKASVSWTSTHWEEHVLREHHLGDFTGFLMATAKHPAMLVYLDNHLSRRPPSPSEIKRIEREARERTGSKAIAKEQAELARQRGLNENYARELMELHTLGVDNGYEQKDVVEVAKALTGWTVDYDAEGSGFVFDPDKHARGTKYLMGRALPRLTRDKAIREGEEVIERLASHRNTSVFIATKLATWLVSDFPPEEIIEDAATTYRKERGDLKEVVRTILFHERFFDREHYRAKFKTPLEFVLSALRATRAEVEDADVILRTVDRLRMPLYECEDPTGYRDIAESWRDPGVMALRWRFALDLTMGKLKGLAVPDNYFYGLPEDPLETMDILIERLVPSGLGPATAAVIERVVFQDVAAGKARDAKGRLALARKVAGILIGSPEFQQQ